MKLLIPVLDWTHKMSWILPPWRSWRIDDMGEFVPRPRKKNTRGPPLGGNVIWWRIAVVAPVQGLPTLISVHPPRRAKFFPGVPPYGRILAPASDYFFAKGPPPGDMSWCEGLMWLTLHRGGRPWLVSIRPVVYPAQWCLTLIGVHWPGQAKILSGVPPYGRFMPRPRKNIARGPPLWGVSCSDGLLWLPLHRGARTLLVSIRPGEPEFSMGSPPDWNECIGRPPWRGRCTGGRGGSVWSHPCAGVPNYHRHPSSLGTQVCLGVPPRGVGVWGLGSCSPSPYAGAPDHSGGSSATASAGMTPSSPADGIPAHPCRWSPSPCSSARIRAVTAWGAPRHLPCPLPRHYLRGYPFGL